ncbi:MAG: hypothetical protein KI785_03900 [Devosiaceae bacterium]|nr:hypothetical protein [Devosiaceae bacterium MH13]
MSEAPARPHKTSRLKTAVYGALALIVFAPPFAGVTFVVLRLLGDPSYDLSRFSLSDVPRAVLAVGLSGSAYGYLYGLIPAFVAAIGLCWIVGSGRTLNFSSLALCVLAGGIVGAVVGSPFVGTTQALALVILMLGLTAAAWFSLKALGIVSVPAAPAGRR